MAEFQNVSVFLEVIPKGGPSQALDDDGMAVLYQW